MMIERIRREHGYMVRLLAILRQKLTTLQAEQPINYSLVAEIVAYLASHSERVHHPKEDLLYQYYQANYGHCQEMANLEHEHAVLAKQTEEFSVIVDMILQDAVIPQTMFLEHLAGFIQAQKQHLEMEERLILPLIVDSFTPEDWQKVESQWTQCEEDPVFGFAIADQYKQLAERVRQSNSECI